MASPWETEAEVRGAAAKLTQARLLHRVGRNLVDLDVIGRLDAAGRQELVRLLSQAMEMIHAHARVDSEDDASLVHVRTVATRLFDF